jgi:copper homeostasis protein CutC
MADRRIVAEQVGGIEAEEATPGPDEVATISANHGHVTVLTGAAITAANAVTLNIQGSADQAHGVSLSAAEVQRAGAGQRASKLSSTDAGHDHTVTFN